MYETPEQTDGSIEEANDKSVDVDEMKDILMKETICPGRTLPLYVSVTTIWL